MTTRFLNVPGITNSGPRHWQTLWEQQFPNVFRRIEQVNWDTPVCDEWIAEIEKQVRFEGPEKVVLTAHSLGCTAVAHWAKRYGTKIKGAMLVAPSDCEAPSYSFESTGFTPIPMEPLPFPSLVVASLDDRYVSPVRALAFANAWNSEYVEIGRAGHINGDSGHGEWPEGRVLLRRVS